MRPCFFISPSTLAVCAVLASAPLVRGQSAPESRGGEPGGLKPIEQGVADVGPFGLSFRRMQLDFRRPLGFDRVYELAKPAGSASGSSSSQGQLARVSGALTAVFPRSLYVTNRDGQTFAAIPAGTRFVIGDPANSINAEPVTRPVPAPHATAATTAADTAAPSAADHRVPRAASRIAATSPVAAPADSPSEEPPCILNDDDHRVRRVKLLLAEAATTGESSPEPASPKE